MPYSSLRDFMNRLEREKRLVRVHEPVSTVLEMTEVETRLLAEGGPAVLFENAVQADGRRSTMPVLVNLFGTVERVAWGMDRLPHQLREVGETLAFLRQPEPPGGWREALELLPLARTVLAMKPKTVSSAPGEEIVWRDGEIDLNRLPIQTCWPGEPAPLITWPLVVTRGPSTRREDDYNLGIYRMQVTGARTTLMRGLKHRGGAQHFSRWQQEKQEKLPAGGGIGADPGTIPAARAPWPGSREDATRSNVPVDLHRPAARRTLGARRGAQRGVHSAAAAAISRDRRFLAAAGGLLVSDRRGRDQEGLSGPRQAPDDGGVVVSPAVHVHEVGDRRGRRHRRAKLEGRPSSFARRC